MISVLSQDGQILINITNILDAQSKYAYICDPLRENQPYAKKKKKKYFRDFALFIPDL